jgi:hypothetical protein
MNDPSHDSHDRTREAPEVFNDTGLTVLSEVELPIDVVKSKMLGWDAMDKKSEGRVKKLYQEKRIEEGSIDDQRLRKDLLSAVAVEDAGWVECKGEKVFFKRCITSKKSGGLCGAIIVMPDSQQTQKTKWYNVGCRSCQNRKCQNKRNLRLKGKLHTNEIEETVNGFASLSEGDQSDLGFFDFTWTGDEMIQRPACLTSIGVNPISLRNVIRDSPPRSQGYFMDDRSTSPKSIVSPSPKGNNHDVPSMKSSSDMQSPGNSTDAVSWERRSDLLHQATFSYSPTSRENGQKASSLTGADRIVHHEQQSDLSLSVRTATSGWTGAESGSDRVDLGRLLNWKEMDRYSQRRLTSWYEIQKIKNGSSTDRKLRSDLSKVLRTEGIDYAECEDRNYEKVYCRPCGGAMKSGRTCTSVIVMPESSSQAFWTLNCCSCSVRRSNYAGWLRDKHETKAKGKTPVGKTTTSRR